MYYRYRLNLILIFFIFFNQCLYSQIQVEINGVAVGSEPYAYGDLYLVLHDTVTILEYDSWKINTGSFSSHWKIFKLLYWDDYFQKETTKELEYQKINNKDYLEYKISNKDYIFQLFNLELGATDGKTNRIYDLLGDRRINYNDSPAYYFTFLGEDSLRLKNGFVAQVIFDKSIYSASIDTSIIEVFGKKQVETSFGEPVYDWISLTKKTYVRPKTFDHICFGINGLKMFTKIYDKSIQLTDKPFILLLTDNNSSTKKKNLRYTNFISLAGIWTGIIAENKEIKINIELNNEDKLKGYDEIQWIGGVNPDRVNFTGTFNFDTKEIEFVEQGDSYGLGKFTGKLSQDFTTMSGTWKRFKGKTEPVEWSVRKK